jgi:hypothetical protein
MRVWRNDTELDATFAVESDRGRIAIRFESRSGTKGSSHVRNVDYNDGLELLLTRLSDLDAVIDDIVVDSQRVRNLGLPSEKRRLTLRHGRVYPLRIRREADIRELRLAISAAQRSVGRAEGVRHGGGNNTKQIRILVADLGIPLTTVRHVLTYGADPKSSSDG